MKHQDMDQFIEEMMKTPLFMKTMPTEKDLEENDTLSALNSLIYDGTPDEIAENFKKHGNEAFQSGPRNYRHAIHYYTKALSQDPSVQLQATILVNRAAVNLNLGNYRKVLNDCSQVFELDAEKGIQVKAYYRAAKALLALDKVEEAADCCVRGLQVDGKNEALSNLKGKVEERTRVLQQAEMKRREREERKRKDEELLQKAILDRGITMITSKAPKNSTSEDSDDDAVHDNSLALGIDTAHQGSHQPTYDSESQTLSFPVIFVYPQNAQSDLISSFNEEHTFADHLDVMFEQPPPWDTKSEYKLENLEIYAEVQKGEGLGLIRVGKQLTLKDVLRVKGYRVLDGVCTFFVIPSGEYAKIWKKRYKTKKQQ
ncbi:hypothetical protein BC832DRAFT_532006 [Gaertneriomyces semiglobifer]|nr:hypothetical protein BC832DRAFT_532006 [Gaertneriomyces semiglobifer]